MLARRSRAKGLVVGLAAIACVLGLTGAEAAFGPLDQQFRISFMGPDGKWEYGAFEPGVAYNSTADEYLVVWAGDDNTPPLVDNEFEIFGQRLSGAGTPLGERIRVSVQGANGDQSSGASSPSVAYNPNSNEYLVVWQGTVGGTSGDVEIWGRRISATGVTLGVSDDLQLSEMGGPGNAVYDASHPKVAANSTTGEYFVVWSGDTPGQGLADDELEIFGQRVSAEGAQVAPDDLRISEQGADGNPNADAEYPSVAYDPARDEYLVAWQGDVGTGAFDLIEIWAQRLSATGAEVGGSDFPVSRPGEVTDDIRFDDLTPSIGVNPTTGEYLVAWEGDGPFGQNDDEFEIYAQLVSGNGARVGDRVRVSDQGPDSDPRFDAVDASVAYDPSAGEYLVAWDGDGFSAPPVDYEFEVSAQRLSAAAKQVGGDFRISHTGPDGNSIYEGRAASVAANPATGEYLVVWQGAEEIEGSLNTEVEIFGRRLGLAAPMLVATDPPGPANENNPRVKGSVDPSARVDIFTNSHCLGAPVVNDAPGSDLNGSGIAVPVADNTVTELTATAAEETRTSRCSNSIAYTEVSPPQPPAPPPPAPPVLPVDRAPVVSGFVVAPKRVRAGRRTTFRFRLSERATARIVVERVGRKKRPKRAASLTFRNRPAGQNRIAFRARRLAAGTYRATIIATDSGGKRSVPRRASFRIVRRR